MNDNPRNPLLLNLRILNGHAESSLAAGSGRRRSLPSAICYTPVGSLSTNRGPSCTQGRGQYSDQSQPLRGSHV